MRKYTARITFVFLIFLFTYNPLPALCSSISAASDNSISGEVKLYEALDVKDESNFGDGIDIWIPRGGEVGLWDQIWGTVSDVVSDTLNAVTAWFAGLSFIQKVFLAALLVFAAVAVAVLLIFGSAAVLAAVVIGLIGAAIVGIYSVIAGEDGFSFWTAVGLGIGGSVLAAAAYFTGAGAVVLGFLTQTALPWLTRAALPAIGRLLLEGWRVFTNRFLPWVGLQIAKAWGVFTSAIVPKIISFLSSSLFKRLLIVGVGNGVITMAYEGAILYFFEHQIIHPGGLVKHFVVGFITGFIGGFIPGFLIAKNVIRQGKLLHRLIGFLSTFSFDIFGSFLLGESIGKVDVVVALVSSIIAVEIGIHMVSLMGEFVSGFTGSITKFFGEGFKRWQASGFAIPGLGIFKAKVAPKVDNFVNTTSQSVNELVVEFKGIRVPDFGKSISIDIDLKDLGRSIDSMSSNLSKIGDSLNEIDFTQEFKRGTEVKGDSED